MGTKRHFPKVDAFLGSRTVIVDTGEVPELKKAGLTGYIILEFVWDTDTDDDGEEVAIPDFNVYLAQDIGAIDQGLTLPAGLKGSMALLKWLNDMSDKLIDQDNLADQVLDIDYCDCDDDS